MRETILDLVEESKLFNSKIFSLPRLLILSSLENFGNDGSSYRELKAGLNMDDGMLFSNLKILKEMRYITKEDVEFENKKIVLIILTNEGKEALVMLRSWIKKWMEVKKDE